MIEFTLKHRVILMVSGLWSVLFVRFPDRPEAGITLATAAEATDKKSFLLLSFQLLYSDLNMNAS